MDPTADLTAAVASCGTPRSVVTATAPVSCTSGVTVREIPATRAPSAVKAVTVASPMPRLAPVTMPVSADRWMCLPPPRGGAGSCRRTAALRAVRRHEPGGLRWMTSQGRSGGCRSDTAGGPDCVGEVAARMREAGGPVRPSPP